MPFDYIICGGGTAGLVVASRLAENPDTSILVIEAGTTKDEVHASEIPAGVSQILGTKADWNIQSEPTPELNNRQLHLGRGKFLGGSSGCNGTLCIRGVPQDYDDWKIDGWGGKEMFNYMKKMECFRNKEWFHATENAHGTKGPSKGLPFEPDLFSTGERAHGCGHAIRTIYKGVRTNSVDYLTNSRASSNIEVWTDRYVDKVLLRTKGDGIITAFGVQVQHANGKTTTVEVGREVILTAGAYGSPAILLRSGIGPSEELSELDISTTLNLPGVGKNLMDHMVMLSFYEVSKPGLTNDHLIWHTGAREKTMQEYQESRTGFLSQFPFGVFAFARLDDRLRDSIVWQNAQRADGRDAMSTLPNQPHVEFRNTECYSPKYMFRDFPPDGRFAFAMATTFFSPKSRGEVTLASKDPMVNPKVQHNFLNDPIDMLVFSEGCRLANEIVLDGQGTKDIIVDSWPAAHGHHKFTTREE